MFIQKMKMCAWSDALPDTNKSVASWTRIAHLVQKRISRLNYDHDRDSTRPPPAWTKIIYNWPWINILIHRKKDGNLFHSVAAGSAKGIHWTLALINLGLSNKIMNKWNRHSNSIATTGSTLPGYFNYAEIQQLCFFYWHPLRPTTFYWLSQNHSIQPCSEVSSSEFISWSKQSKFISYRENITC